MKNYRVDIQGYLHEAPGEGEVECSSCGSFVPEDETLEFYVGDVLDTRHFGALGEVDVDFDISTVRNGVACYECADAGPSSFPSSYWAGRFGRWFGGEPVFMVIAIIAASWVIGTFVLLAAGLV